MLGGEEIGKRRVDHCRAELSRYRGERALWSLSSFGTFDRADVNELEGRLRVKPAAATGVDPGWQGLAWLDESPNPCWWGGLGDRYGCGALSIARGSRLAGCRLAGSRLSHELPCRSAAVSLSRGAGSVYTDLAGRAVRPPVAGDATDCGLHRKRAPVEGMRDAGGNAHRGKHGQSAQDAAPAGAVSAGRHRYRERIEPAGVHALLLPQLRCNLAPVAEAPRCRL
jgi:hypothetical protein